MRDMRRSACTGKERQGAAGSERGFSLPEMLAVVALIALVVLVAIPAFGNFTRSYKLRTAADEMLAAARGVRQMAISTRQDLTITFNPGSPGSYTYFHPIQGQTITVQLPDQVTVTTNPSASFTTQFRPNGSIVPSSTPSVSNPTANFVRLSKVISTSRTDTYTYGFSAAGQVSYTVTH